MPTYAYTCTACGHSFDIQQSFSDDALSVCPECSGRLRKIFSAVGVTFKGSGFYRTDSRSGSKSSVPAASKAAAASSSGGSSSGGSSSSSSAGSSTSSSSGGSSSGGSSAAPAAS